jgi:hypothetical protein
MGFMEFFGGGSKNEKRRNNLTEGIGGQAVPGDQDFSPAESMILGKRQELIEVKEKRMVALEQKKMKTPQDFTAVDETLLNDLRKELRELNS